MRVSLNCFHESRLTAKADLRLPTTYMYIKPLEQRLFNPGFEACVPRYTSDHHVIFQSLHAVPGINKSPNTLAQTLLLLLAREQDTSVSECDLSRFFGAPSKPESYIVICILWTSC
jgi:hypothetical protein